MDVLLDNRKLSVHFRRATVVRLAITKLPQKPVLTPMPYRAMDGTRHARLAPLVLPATIVREVNVCRAVALRLMK